ncbi:MAG: OmpH family outer membrane protein [Deltaproteobacteria bacterium]|nr:OmpH family outer membrane protein [Deltaproteobacteria bacterium]
MKKLIRLLLAVLILTVVCQDALAADSYKIAVIDLQKCIDRSKEGQRLSEKLNQKKEALQKKINEKEQELVEIQEEIEKQDMMLSLDAQESKRREFDRKRRDLQYYYQDVTDEYNKAESEARKAFLKDLEGIVKKMALDGKYDLILERRSGGIIFASDVMDITEIVIQEYDKIKP